MIHAPYLQSKTTLKNGIPPLNSGHTYPTPSYHQADPAWYLPRVYTPDDIDSSVVDEQSSPNNLAASESSLNNSLSSTSPLPGHSIRPKNSKTYKKHGLSCNTCGCTFDQRYKLNQHVNRKHNKRFKCPVNGCPSVFGLQTDLDRHKKTHQAQERFHCPETNCQSHFTRKDNLKRHQRECH